MKCIVTDKNGGHYNCKTVANLQAHIPKKINLNQELLEHAKTTKLNFSAKISLYKAVVNLVISAFNWEDDKKLNIAKI